VEYFGDPRPTMRHEDLWRYAIDKGEILIIGSCVCGVVDAFEGVWIDCYVLLVMTNSIENVFEDLLGCRYILRWQIEKYLIEQAGAGA
jgi:hypothetical protein